MIRPGLSAVISPTTALVSTPETANSDSNWSSLSLVTEINKPPEVWASHIRSRCSSLRLSSQSTESSIPVIFRYKHGLPHEKSIIKLTVELEKLRGNSKNVVGFLDNKADQTVVIGAHYDHLGYGTSGSLYRGEPDIHNGADDNASGVALLLELARYLSTDKLLKNNYLFIAFSGEELGLYGSNYFVKNAPIDLKKVKIIQQ